jgi:hypothetical protein
LCPQQIAQIDPGHGGTWSKLDRKIEALSRLFEPVLGMKQAAEIREIPRTIRITSDSRRNQIDGGIQFIGFRMDHAQKMEAIRMLRIEGQCALTPIFGRSKPIGLKVT